MKTESVQSLMINSVMWYSFKFWPKTKFLHEADCAYCVTRGWFYSETTWAFGIAQLTHHEVRGGDKNPEAGGRRIFAPTPDRVGS